jgi:stearoyl-CoA desaturase (delta-9 desaturase)
MKQATITPEKLSAAAAYKPQIGDLATATSDLPIAAKVAQKVKQDLRMGREHQQGRVNWITTIVMGLFHVGAIAALFCFSWANLTAFFVMYFLAINVGIGVAYHRLLTHRGFRTPKWVEYFVTACGTMALEGGPIFWVATHRVHHQNSDQEGDPHTPVDGTPKPPFSAATLLTSLAIPSTSGSASTTGCR